MAGYGVQGFDHVGLTVADLDIALAFWEPFLGVKASSRGLAKPGGLVADLTGLRDAAVEGAKLDLPSGGYIELYNYIVEERGRNGQSTANIGNVHVCLRVSDIAEAWQRAIDLGATSVSAGGPVRIPSGPSAGARAVYLRVHDGITVELIELSRQIGATGS